MNTIYASDKSTIEIKLNISDICVKPAKIHVLCRLELNKKKENDARIIESRMVSLF